MIFILTYMHICIHTYIQKAIQTYKQQTYIHTNLQTYLKYRKGEREHRERSNKRDSKEDRKRDKGRQPWVGEGCLASRHDIVYACTYLCMCVWISMYVCTNLCMSVLMHVCLKCQVSLRGVWITCDAAKSRRRICAKVEFPAQKCWTERKVRHEAVSLSDSVHGCRIPTDLADTTCASQERATPRCDFSRIAAGKTIFL